MYVYLTIFMSLFHYILAMSELETIYIYIYIIWKEKLILFITFDCDFVLKNIEINTYTLNLLHNKTLRKKFP